MSININVYVNKNMNNNTRVATTIKIDAGLYDEFKILSIRNKTSLQNFVDKCIFKYVKDNTFQNEINNFTVPLPDPVVLPT